MSLGKRFATLEVKIVVFFHQKLKVLQFFKTPGCSMSHLYIPEDLNLLQHWCIVESNNLKEQKCRCYCMDCSVK
jgi:hypothetical protein